MNRRGQGSLPMNTLIVAIIAIIVLLLVVTFFTGGLGTVGEKIRSIFQKSTAGYDLNIARNFCKDYCSAAKDLDVSQQPNSAYCKEKFDIKPAGGGNLETKGCQELIGACPPVACPS